MSEQISPSEAAFERIRNTIGLFLGPIVFLIIYFSSFPSLSPEAHKLAAILAWTIIYWVCEPIPIPVTALLSAAFCVVLGVSDARNILASFADPVVFLFLGSFILSQAMMVHQLDRRIALTILSIGWVGNDTRRILFVFGAIAAFLSMWLSNTATTAMLLPSGLGILSEIGNLMEKQSGKSVQLRHLKMSCGLMLMTAYASSIGGIGTPIGSPPNLIGIGMINRLLDVNIDFIQWMKFTIPLLIILYFILYFLLRYLHSPEIRQLSGLSDYLKSRKSELGPWTLGQINTLVAFLFVVTLWVFPGILSLIYGADAEIIKEYRRILPEGVIAILAAGLLFFLPINWKSRQFTIQWRDAVEIDWGTILLFGGGIALGGLTFATGLAEIIGTSIVEITGVTSYGGIVAISILLAITISETTSNTAAANMVIPISIAVAQAAGVNPIGPALGACLGASHVFMLPVATPPNAIAYGSGMIPITKMVKTGVILDIISFGLIWCGIMILLPLVGLE